MSPAVVEVTQSPRALAVVVAARAVEAVLALAGEDRLPGAVVAVRAGVAQDRVPAATKAARVDRVAQAGPAVAAGRARDPVRLGIAASPVVAQGRVRGPVRLGIAVSPVVVADPAPAVAEDRRATIAAVRAAIVAQAQVRVPADTEAGLADQVVPVAIPLPVVVADRAQVRIPADTAGLQVPLAEHPIGRATAKAIQVGPGPRVIAAAVNVANAAGATPVDMGKAADRATTEVIGTETTIHRQSFRPVPKVCLATLWKRSCVSPRLHDRTPLWYRWLRPPRPSARANSIQPCEKQITPKVLPPETRPYARYSRWPPTA